MGANPVTVSGNQRQFAGHGASRNGGQFAVVVVFPTPVGPTSA